jgi:ABC-type uncharacterized transport system substrate-binding protein
MSEFMARHPAPGETIRSRSGTRMVWAGLVALCTCPLLTAQEAPARIAVLCGAKGPYRVAAEATAKELNAAGHETVLIELPEEGDAAARRQALDQLSKSKAALVAAGGAAATVEALKALPGTPVVFFMVPNALDAPFLRPNQEGPARISGIASDIAPSDQVDWIVRTSPGTKRVAVLSSPRTQQTAAALEKAGQARGITVTTFQAAREEFPAAIEALDTSACDGVLMIPDAQVYNSPNVERLLLWGARNRKPIWAFSENVVAAGAFAGLYCDPPTVGKQAAELIRQVLRKTDDTAPGLHYPRGLGQAVRGVVNTHTAKMIGVSIDERVVTNGVTKVGEQ